MDFINKFREALKIPTWWPPEAKDGDREAEAPLLRFREFLADNFDAFHRAAERYVLSPYSVIYRLPGSDGGSRAVLIIAHYDVVPAETEKWSVDPFGAEMKDGFIYGRGSLDMKNTLVSVMEAADNLCAQGWKPGRDIWFAFGGDEERTGIFGAMEMAKWFSGKGQKFEWILDEGTPIAEKQIKGIDVPLALISVEEKGFLSLDLTVTQEPGHASKPPKVQAAAVLARALCRLGKKPFPFRLNPTVETFFSLASPMMPAFQGFVMRHARAFGPLFFALAAADPAAEAMLRTTVAMTQLEGSAADNVLPSQVRAVINLRLLWPMTVEAAVAFIKKTIGDERVRVSAHGLGTDPVAASGEFRRGGRKREFPRGWAGIQGAMEEAWPGIPLLPFIMVATTDSRHYQQMTDNIFRFSPYKLDNNEYGRIHGHNERISVENLNRGLAFYSGLLKSL
jgi:carboxypeptidase PM20D1